MDIANQRENASAIADSKFSLATLVPYIKYYLLPLLAAAYPSLFFYGNNAHNLLLTNLGRTLIIYILIATILYLAFVLTNRKSPLKAAVATLIFLIFFNLYGMLENLFLRLDWFAVYDFITLPVTLLLAGYAIWLISKLNEKATQQIWNYTSIILGGMIMFNLIIIIPKEVSKLQQTKTTQVELAQAASVTKQHLPDIYYIILDEFSGLKPMRDYWNNPKVNDFEKFLTSKGFTVFQDPHGSSTNTLNEIASRLNYQRYPQEHNEVTQKIWFDAISDNKAMNYLKQSGYSIVTFNEMQYAYPSAPSVDGDATYSYDDIPTTDLGVYFDDFGVLVADNTMLNVFSAYYKRLGSTQHSNMVFYTTTKIGDLREIASPKFVYVHLLIPHIPFMFDQNGNVNATSSYKDYSYYLGNYNFAIFLATKMVNNILSDADPFFPPVIILQSDHGLRNMFEEEVTGQLENFPDEYKTSILYAIRLPGFEPTYTAQEMDPINTFPIVFNHLFDAGIPLK